MENTKHIRHLLSVKNDGFIRISVEDENLLANYYRTATDLEKLLIDDKYPQIEAKAEKLSTRTVRIRVTAKADVETFVDLSVNDDKETFKEYYPRAIAAAATGDYQWKYRGIIDGSLDITEETTI